MKHWSNLFCHSQSLEMNCFAPSRLCVIKAFPGKQQLGSSRNILDADVREERDLCGPVSAWPERNSREVGRIVEKGNNTKHLRPVGPLLTAWRLWPPALGRPPIPRYLTAPTGEPRPLPHSSARALPTPTTLWDHSLLELVCKRCCK